MTVPPTARQVCFWYVSVAAPGDRVGSCATNPDPAEATTAAADATEKAVAAAEADVTAE